MTAPALLQRYGLYAALVLLALALGVFTPWGALVAWSAAVVVDSACTGLAFAIRLIFFD